MRRGTANGGHGCRAGLEGGHINRRPARSTLGHDVERNVANLAELMMTAIGHGWLHGEGLQFGLALSGSAAVALSKEFVRKLLSLSLYLSRACFGLASMWFFETV